MKITAIILSIIAFIKGLFGMGTVSTSANISLKNPVAIKMKVTAPVNFSAISTRITYKYEGGTVTAPEVKVNQDLIVSGWNYPIKKVTVNEDHSISLDLALIYLNPQGALVNGELTLATLNFKDDISNIKFTENFDIKLTKFITKTNEEKKVIFDKGEFIIN